MKPKQHKGKTAKAVGFMAEADGFKAVPDKPNVTDPNPKEGIIAIIRDRAAPQEDRIAAIRRMDRISCLSSPPGYRGVVFTAFGKKAYDACKGICDDATEQQSVRQAAYQKISEINGIIGPINEMYDHFRGSEQND